MHGARGIVRGGIFFFVGGGLTARFAGDAAGTMSAARWLAYDSLGSGCGTDGHVLLFLLSFFTRNGPKGDRGALSPPPAFEPSSALSPPPTAAGRCRWAKPGRCWRRRFPRALGGPVGVGPDLAAVRLASVGPAGASSTAIGRADVVALGYRARTSLAVGGRLGFVGSVLLGLNLGLAGPAWPLLCLDGEVSSGHDGDGRPCSGRWMSCGERPYLGLAGPEGLDLGLAGPGRDLSPFGRVFR
jgi:hypothetical protein